MARLDFVVSQIREIEETRQKRLEQQPETGPHIRRRIDEAGVKEPTIEREGDDRIVVELPGSPILSGSSN